MDYFEIGQRIRKFRKALGMSQEQLAEKVGISVTHMSHIETGNTKLSLVVLVDIANALGEKTDTILFGSKKEDRGTLSEEISELLEDCSVQEALFIKDLMISAKTCMRKNDLPAAR